MASVKGQNPYLKYFSSKAGKYRAFCQKYNVPDDVEVRLVCGGDITFSDDHITVPLLAIIEGGLRFPVNELLRQFIHEYQINPRFLAMNSFRIINGLFALREKFNLVFNIFYLVGCITFQRTAPPSAVFCLFGATSKSLGHT